MLETKNRFRILRDWRVDLDITSEYKGQLSLSPSTKQATIYGWDEGEPAPADYYCHELLHIALEALRRIPEPQAREAEEFLIQDICNLALNGL